MAEMTSRQRVVAALRHEEPDRVPWDCQFTIEAYWRLKKYLGINPKNDPMPSTYALTISTPPELLEELQVDLCYVGLAKPKSTPVFEYGMNTYTDDWGIGYRKIKLPMAGYYYEFAHHPLANATIKDLDDFPWPDPADPERVAGLEEKCRAIYEQTGLALVGRFNDALFEQAFMLRGLEKWYTDLALNQEFVEALLTKLTDNAIGKIEAGLKACGKYLTILRLAGDDMGHQQGTLLSPRMFRKSIKPHFARLYRTAKSRFMVYNPQGKMKAHTDGDIYPLIPDYIEMGLDVLNPVQPYVAEMDHARLKAEFGDRLSFHGAIDQQRVLPFGSPEEVWAEAIKTMSVLGRHGGFIVAPTHYVQGDVPPENIVALRDAVLQRGKYPLTGAGR